LNAVLFIAETDNKYHQKQKRRKPKVYAFRSFCGYLYLVSVHTTLYHRDTGNKKNKKMKLINRRFRGFNLLFFLVYLFSVDRVHTTDINQVEQKKRMMKPKVLSFSSLLFLLGDVHCGVYTQPWTTNQVQQEAETDKPKV